MRASSLASAQHNSAAEVMRHTHRHILLPAKHCKEVTLQYLPIKLAFASEHDTAAQFEIRCIARLSTCGRVYQDLWTS